jgi:hypothetical protein
MNTKFREDNQQLNDLLGSLPAAAKLPQSIKAERTKLAAQEEQEAARNESARQKRLEAHLQKLFCEGVTVRELDAAERP